MSSEVASSATRTSLLDATKRVMQRDGAGHLTLDAVAKEAGVSKGGLLYHFPTKQALLRGIVERGMQLEEERLSASAAARPGEKAWACTFIEHTLGGKKGAECDPPPELVWAVLSAAANDPTLLEPIRQMHLRWQRRLDEEGIDPTLATLLLMVGHGVWSTEMFALSPLEANVRTDLQRLLCQLIGAEATTPGEGREAEEK